MPRNSIPVAFALLAGIGPVSMALADEPAPAGRPVTVPRAEQFDLRSKSGREYRIFVAGPAGEIPDPGAPVIYLSDGNANFPILLEAARRQAREAPQVVVVGIGYPTEDGAVHRERRAYDLTPASSAPASGPGGGPPLVGGGNDEFLGFIEEELKPEIGRRYKIDRRRQGLFGHSFGGLFVLHVLFSKPEAFQVYLASSPSIWWNDGSILAEERAFAEKYADKEVDARVLISIGEWEQRPRPDVPKERAELLKNHRMVGNAKELAGRLTASKINGLAAEFREFPEEEHGSVVLPAASRGARFMLQGK